MADEPSPKSSASRRLAVHKGWHSRGYLPHFDTPERAQHVVFRTADSLPVHITEEFDRALDVGHGARPFSNPAFAEIVENALLHFDGARYDLLAWCVMPNHVHVVAAWRDGWRLGDSVKSWKTFCAQAIHRVTGDGGAFWARDYFDRYARDERDLEKLIAYVENNPVAAGLCARPDDFRYSSARRRA